MARKIVNRKELRAEAEAAETLKKKAKKKKAPKKKKKAAKKKAKKRASRAKAAQEVRLKLYWGVFSQSLKRVALFEFNQRKQAEKKAEELSKGGKSPHFVQRVKEAVEEKPAE